MDPSWLTGASQVLTALRTSKSSGAGAGSGSYSGLAELDLGTWAADGAKDPYYKWAILGGVLVIGLVVINRKFK